jgi:hypothetical protein
VSHRAVEEGHALRMAVDQDDRPPAAGPEPPDIDVAPAEGSRSLDEDPGEGSGDIGRGVSERELDLPLREDRYGEGEILYWGLGALRRDDDLLETVAGNGIAGCFG